MTNEQAPRRVASLTVRTLRCLSHPLRLRMLEILRSDGPGTSTGLAKQFGTNSANASWHLRQLADCGFIEEDIGHGNGRERWWRAVHDALNLDSELVAGVQPGDEVHNYLHELAAQRFDALSRAVTELPTWPEEWKRTASMSDTVLSMTARELGELNERMHELVRSYRRPKQDGDAEVIVQWQAFPRRSDGSGS